jgi:S-formylglutathione hydrolase FrmB
MSTESESPVIAPVKPAWLAALERRDVRIAAALAASTVVIVAGTIALIRSGVFDHVSLLRGPFPWLIKGSAIASIALALTGRDRKWWTRQLPIAVAATTVVVLFTAWTLKWSGTITDKYPRTFLVWTGGAVFSLASLAPGFMPSAIWRKVVRFAALPLTVFAAFLLINAQYGYWPTLGGLLGRPIPGQVSKASLEQQIAAPPRPQHVIETSLGELAPFDPPATVSHFRHRVGAVYLPPAFFSAQRATLPVIVMLGGVPGTPSAWPRAGYAVATANDFAAAHHGVAPVLVFADQNGTATADSECVDRPHMHAETYLTVDVPAYIESDLHIAHDAGRWAIAGFSEGGTCAIDIGLRHPLVYGHFMDFAGDLAPNIGSHENSLRKLFGGSIEKMVAYDPWLIMHSHHYFNVTACFVAGSDDPLHYKLMQQQADAATNAGIVAHLFLFPGEGHTWQFAAAAFKTCLPVMAPEVGIY